MAQPTRALVIIDVQNDFMSPKGNFPCPDAARKPLIKNLKSLVPHFRETGGHIIWVKAIYENRVEEPAGMRNNPKGTGIGSNEWLTEATHVYHIPCCEANTFGAEIYPEVLALADPTDAFITKGFYSSFTENTQLTDILRAKNVTDAYFCGLATGTCVLATTLDAIKLGDWRVHVVPDCCGWRRLPTHVEAIERMKTLPVNLVNSYQFLESIGAVTKALPRWYYVSVSLSLISCLVLIFCMYKAAH